jgi:hypothetical protein
MLNDGEVKADLQRYLQVARDVLVWKLDGLSEYEIRRPLTPTATNLLGLVKHLAGVELGYFGLVFDRPFDGQVAWFRPDLPEDALDPAGHADIVRELVDGAVGLRKDASNLPSADQAWWDHYRDQVDRAAQVAGKT